MVGVKLKHDDAAAKMTDLDKIVERVQKILALGRRGGTEAEAAAATVKAQELLARYNLDMATVEGAPTTREKLTRDTGMYIYQRNLWRAVAELNFCLCFKTQKIERYRGRLLLRNKIMVVGRKMNTRTTMARGPYVVLAIERLCRERLNMRAGEKNMSGNVHQQFFSKWAISFREGAADRVVEKIQARREIFLRKEKKREMDRKKKMSEGASTATGVSLMVYQDAETDANYDFMYGEGTSARWAANRAARAAEAAKEEKEYAEWAIANPEKAAAEAKKMRKQRISYGRAPRDPDWGAYRAGQEAGKKIGIDPQTEGATQKRISR